MKTLKLLILTFLICFSSTLLAQEVDTSFEPSKKNPYGQPNPEAPSQIKDFTPMIGKCECTSTVRNAGQEWSEPQKMIWTFKYIMNGMAVQDETWKADGVHSGSIRQYNADSAKWYVHYYSTSGAVPVLPAWEGEYEREEGRIRLYRDQPAPNGMEGFYRLTFYDFTNSGYKWIGEWVDKDEKIAYPTWKIECRKVE